MSFLVSLILWVAIFICCIALACGMVLLAFFSIGGVIDIVSFIISNLRRVK